MERNKFKNKQEDMVGDTNFSNLFVTRIPKHVTKEVLIKEFGKYGDVEMANLKTITLANGEVVSKGQAMVAFRTKEDAQRALSEMTFDNPWNTTLQIDFYRTREGRMKEFHEKQQIHHPLNKLLNNQFSKPAYG